MYWLLRYEVVDKFIELRTQYRDAHLALARAANDRGELLLAGAFAEPADGAAIVFKGEDKSAAERFATSDPYVTAGLVKDWTIRQWTVVVGGDAPG